MIIRTLLCTLALTAPMLVGATSGNATLEAPVYVDQPDRSAAHARYLARLDAEADAASGSAAIALVAALHTSCQGSCVSAR